MTSKSDSALLIVGHGSTLNPDSSTPTWTHAREIQRRKVFADVRCAFWKEEPSLRDARFFFADEMMREVFVVPNFISEGYFTQTVIPRELELDGTTTRRANGQIWIYCEPVGNNSLVTELLLARAHEIAPNAEPTETALLIVAHGTELNDNSAIAAKREAERIRARGEFATVLNAYMEEPPLIAEWNQLTNAPSRKERSRPFSLRTTLSLLRSSNCAKKPCVTSSASSGPRPCRLTKLYTGRQ